MFVIKVQGWFLLLHVVHNLQRCILAAGFTATRIPGPGNTKHKKKVFFGLAKFELKFVNLKYVATRRVNTSELFI